jgi:hypothetical protein
VVDETSACHYGGDTARGASLSPGEFRNTFGAWQVRPSALKHAIAVEDTLHAVEQCLIIYSLTDEREGGPLRQLHLGPDRAGNLLEVVVLIRDDGIGLIIHSMRMRPKYQGLLP